MSYRPSKSFLICLTPLLVTAAAGAWAWNKADGVPMRVRTNTTFWSALKYKNAVELEKTDGERAKMRPVVDAAMDKLALEFPALKMTDHPVPDEKNGFLFLFKLGGPPNFRGKPITDEFEQFLLNDTTPWDPVKAMRLLAENAAFVEKAEAIGALETRSASHMPDDYTSFITVKPGKWVSDTLMLKARLAADEKDEKEALRLTVAAQHVSDHYIGVESPSLLAATASLLIDQSIRSSVFRHILPTLGKQADLALWKDALTPRPYTAAGFSNLMRGEWHSFPRLMVLPSILDEKSPDHLPDTDALLHTLASHYNELITRCAASSLSGLRETMESIGEHACIHPSLSKRSQEVMTIMAIGCRAWANGYIRTASKLDQYQAALDVMIQEKSGASPEAGAIKSDTVDPITSQAFLYDPATRTINVPPQAATAGVEPLKLPW